MKAVGILARSGDARGQINAEMAKLHARISAAERSAWEAKRDLAAFLNQPGPPPLAPAPLGVQLFTDTADFEQDRTLLRALDEVYFTVPIAPGLAFYEIAAEAKNGDAVVMRYPAGVVSRAYAQVPTRQLWARTRPRMYVWYTSPVGSANTFNLRFNLKVFGPGSNTISAVFQVDWTAAGPAVANDVLLTTVVGSSVFPTSPYGVTQVRCLRVGPDANANDLDVLLALVVFEEVA